MANPKVSTENIDERILQLLNLQDEYELSYGEYIGHLREALVASRMTKSKYSTEETKLLTDEWKRVKRKKPENRFRPKKITAESFKKSSAFGFNISFGKNILNPIPKLPKLLLPIDKLKPEDKSIEKILEVTPKESKETINKLKPEDKNPQNKGKNLVSENIDERVLKLLDLENIFDIDYDTYSSLLKEALVKYAVIGTKKIPTEEVELLNSERKRVKGKTGRFKPKKITAESLKKGSSAEVNLGLGKNILPAIKTSSSLVSLKDLKPDDKSNETGQIEIELEKIITILKDQNKEEKKRQEEDRKNAEAEKRKKRESLLEKGTKFAFKAAEKILAPFKSLLKRIIDFITAIFFGRALIKLIDWFSDPNNKKKVDAIFRFLGDHWPKLLALFIVFGTGLGKFARSLFGIVIQGTRLLIGAAAKLAAQSGVKGAAKIAGFAFGTRGKLIAGALTLGATALTTVGLTKGIESFGGIDGDDKKKPDKNPPPQKTPGFRGGGFAHLKNLFGFAGGAYNRFGYMSGMNNGYVSGEKGVDKIPAMLSDGEFVMSRGAVQKYGVDTLEMMNAAGGGTNRPKIVSGIPHAAGGGLVGKGPKLSPLEIKFATRARQRGINDPIELKAFLSQVKHESGGSFGSPKRELYNPSPNDPPGKPGYEYFRGYTGMNGNRNADDAYNYIGRGYLQITGRSNYEDIGKRIGKDLVNKPQLLMNSDVALDASIEYWKSRVRPNVKNWNNVFEVSRAINKPAAVSPNEIVGMQERNQIFQSYNSIPDKTLMSATTPVVAPKMQKKEPSFIEKLTSGVSSLFGLNQEAKAEPITPLSRSSGGVVPQSIKYDTPVSPTQKNIQIHSAKNNIRSNYTTVTPIEKSRIKVVYINANDRGSKPIIPSAGGTPSVPQFSAMHPSGHSRTAKVLGIK